MSAAPSHGRPWLGLYAPGQPAEMRPQFGSMLDLFEASLAAAPGCAIVRYFDGGLNLRELDQAAPRPMTKAGLFCV